MRLDAKYNRGKSDTPNRPLGALIPTKKPFGVLAEGLIS